MGKNVLSYGGGLNSSALLVWLIENKKPLDLVIMSDTGSEFDFTYEALSFYQIWSSEKGIETVIVKTHIAESLYEYCQDKNIIPSRMRRDCTTKFKISPIRRYLRKRFGEKETFIMYIGIAFDEAHRMRTSDVQYIENNYPLVNAKITRQGCIDYLEERSLLVPKKSGCWFCPFTKKDGWLRLLEEHPDLFDKAIELERNGKRYPEILLNTLPLEVLKRNIKSQTKLTDFSLTCDVAGSCFL